MSSKASTSNNNNNNLLCSASTIFKKQQGYLNLTNRALIWSNQSNFNNISKGNDTNIANNRMSALFSSKEGGAKVMLKISVYPLAGAPPNTPEDSYSFTFTSTSTAISDREHFKTELSAMIQANRARREAEALQLAANDITGVNKSTSISGVSLKGKEKASMDESTSNSFKYKREVLSADVSLAELHRTLVIGGMISESEFWEGREDLLLEAAAKDQQQQGKSGKMVDPKPIQGDGLDYTVKITNELMKDIFAEYPSVLQAFNDNVPQPLDITEFWTRYFQSKLFNRNRTTNRAAVNTVKDDAIFDLYLGEEDDDIEPKNMKHHDIYRLLDLAATEEDQHEVVNQADITMRAGGERASLPLMRRFNEHSERLLNQSLGVTAQQNRMALDPGNAGNRNYYEDIILEDLNDAKSADRIVLNMHQPTKFTSTSNTTTSTNNKDSNSMEGIIDNTPTLEEFEMDQVLERTKGKFEEWEPKLGEFETDQEAMDAAVSDMMTSIRLRAERSSRESNKHSITAIRLSEITTLQTSSNEFLRQFWSAVLPVKVGDLSAQALATPEMKAAKAERMKGCLDKTEVRMISLSSDRDLEGEERRRVEAALQPVREAVSNAIAFYNSRVGGSK